MMRYNVKICIQCAALLAARNDNLVLGDLGLHLQYNEAVQDVVYCVM